MVRSGERGSLPDPAEAIRLAIRRLKHDAPDLAERVLRGEISAYRARVLAGITQPRLSISYDPVMAARLIAREFGTAASGPWFTTLLSPHERGRG
jgi:hypothetical protein